MDLDDVNAVFELVVLADGLRRQLALLTDRHEAAAQPVGHRTAEDEATRLDAGDRLHPAIGEGSRELFDAGTEAVGVTEQRGDVAEHNAGLGIVRYGADEVLEINVSNQAHPGFPLIQRLEAAVRASRAK